MSDSRVKILSEEMELLAEEKATLVEDIAKYEGLSIRQREELGLSVSQLYFKVNTEMITNKLELYVGSFYNHSQFKLGDTLKIYYKMPGNQSKFKLLELSNGEMMLGCIIFSDFTYKYVIRVKEVLNIYKFFGKNYAKIQFAIERYMSTHSVDKIITALNNEVKSQDSNSLFSKVIDQIDKVVVESESSINPIVYFNDKLNKDQKEAIIKLKVSEVSLIHGPPGTGKTTTLVEAILQALSKRQSILVATASNAAIDHIANQFLLVQKERKLNYKAIRIGNTIKISDDIRKIVLSKLVQRKFEVNKYRSIKEKDYSYYISKISQDLVNEADIVFSTLNSSINEFLENRKYLFDLLIIDEASQAITAEIIIPSNYSRRLLICGDHQQLPPVIKSSKKLGGRYITLFERLTSMNFCTYLTEQYRMNQKIMGFPSKMFYESSLNANKNVRFQTMLDYFDYHNPFLNNYSLFAEALGYIDTSDLGFNELDQQYSNSVMNFGEAIIVKNVVDELYKDMKHIKQDDADLMNMIGIITPYMAQRNIIIDKFIHSQEYKNCYESLEINTIDSFQGREKEIIIISLVRSNKYHNGDIGFLNNYRRLNVLLTRAKRLLIIIGDFKTASKNKFMRQLQDHLTVNGYNMGYYLDSKYSEIKSELNTLKNRYYRVKSNADPKLVHLFGKHQNQSHQ